MARYFDRLAPGWDERTGAGGPDHLATLAKAVLEIEPEPERILDVGAGTGAGTLFLAREFPRARVRGVDISPAMVDLAKAKVGLDPEGRIAFRIADAAKLPWPADSFDLLAQTNVPVFLPEIARVLRPGGHLIVARSQPLRSTSGLAARLGRRRLRRNGLQLIAAENAGDGSFSVARLDRNE